MRVCRKPFNRGRKPRLSCEQLEQVRAAIGEQPDITLQELKDKFSLPVSLSALSKTMRNKLELCYKKTIYPAEQHREDVKIKREAWKSAQPEMEI